MEILSYVIVLLQAVVWCDSAVCNGVLQINPNQTSVIEPLGQLVQLDCSAGEGVNVQLGQWMIEIPEIGSRNSGETPATLLRFNITTATTPDLLQLNITGTQVNSGSTFTCRGFIGDQLVLCTTAVTTIFFGPPSAPGDVTATENGVGVLNISWSSVAIEGVDVDFNLTVVNINTSQELVLTTGDLFQVVTLPDNDVSCNVYQFKVTAINRAGSNSSGYITYLPLLVPPVDIQHSLMKTAGGISLHIMINNVQPCPEYPIQNYTLFVDPMDDSEENRTTHITPATGEVVTIVISGLREDLRYSYYVIATNQFGNSNPSTPVEIVTTDVQNVTICQVNSTAFTIHCVFLDGANVSGCNYTLMIVEGGDTAAGSIERVDSEDGETVAIADMNINGSVLLAYDSDLVLDNTTDDLVVRRNITSVVACPTDPTPTDSSPLGLIIGLVVLAVIAVVIVAVTVIALVCHKKGSCATLREEEKPGDGFKNKAALMGESIGLTSVPPVPPSPSTSEQVAAALASGHYEMEQPDDSKYDVLGNRSGNKSTADPLIHAQLQDEGTYSQLVTSQEAIPSSPEMVYSTPLDDRSGKPLQKNLKQGSILSKRASKPRPVAPAPPAAEAEGNYSELNELTKGRAVAVGLGEVDSTYSTPWQGKIRTTSQKDRDRQNSDQATRPPLEDSQKEATEEHLYQVPMADEKVGEKKAKKRLKKKKSPDLVRTSKRDSSKPPPIPPFCPAGGDSPGKNMDEPLPTPPEQPRVPAEEQKYAVVVRARA